MVSFLFAQNEDAKEYIDGQLNLLKIEKDSLDKLIISRGNNFAENYRNYLALKSVDKKIDSIGCELINYQQYNNGLQKSGKRLQSAGTILYWSIIIQAVGLIVTASSSSSTGPAISLVGGIVALFYPYQILKAGEDLERTTGMKRSAGQ
jgi:energy-coupling factor transporter transmembrane protein EcfT